MEKTTQGAPLRAIFLGAAALFALFLLAPMGSILWQSLAVDGAVGLGSYADILARPGFGAAFRNSVLLSAASGLITTALAFLLAYTVNYTRLPDWAGRLIRTLAVLPMLLPTITYGFAIIYSFGRQGLITMLLGGRQFFDIYGPVGLLMGYTIYTLPVSFLLLHNTMGYIDKKFMIVSRAMGDSRWRSFRTTVLAPLAGTFAASFIQSFTLCFTDYGIPTSVGGNTPLMATLLYGEMLGSLPNFHTGSAVAIAMLLPSVAGILLLSWLERYNIRYNKISRVELDKNPVRDGVCGVLSAVVLLGVLSIFLVIFIVPFVDQWPYRLQPSGAHAAAVFADPALMQVYRNSLLVAALTAVLGTLVVYGAALVSARGPAGRPEGRVLDAIALVTSTIPGMVLGVAYLLTFKGTPLQNSFGLIVLCNIIHFFSSPYLMMKNGLEKLSASWETTARLMGDSWLKTVVRIITPNAFSTLLEVFVYFFTNAMVTVSAVIFIAGARTMVITAKIKELQHFADFNEIFVLSILILATNLAAKGLTWLFSHKLTQTERNETKMNNMTDRLKRLLALALTCALCTTGLTGCTSGGSSADEQVVIYSNADDEAVESMKRTLDAGGYAGKYLFQSFGTSELGGKLLAEGADIEADIVTMSSYYLDSAQTQNQMFLDLTFPVNTMDEFPGFYAPFIGNQGALLVNTQVLEEKNLALPTSVADLAKPEYAGNISVVDIQGSSTAWLMIQSLVDAYGEDGARELLTDIYANAGAHLEQSGSAPIKKVRAGEVAIGFGLRHQAVADKASGLPIDFVDPAEGNYTLTESLAVVDKGEDTNPLAMEMVQYIIENGRADLMQNYPVPLYEGETADENALSANSKVFPEALTVELLKKHQELSESCK